MRVAFLLCSRLYGGVEATVIAEANALVGLGDEKASSSDSANSDSANLADTGGANPNFANSAAFDSAKSGEACEVLVIVPKRCEFLGRLDARVRVHEYAAFDKRYNPFLYMEILGVLRGFGADILHTHAVKATQMGLILSKFLPNCAFAATKHNARPASIFSRIKHPIAVSVNAAVSIKNPQNPPKVIYFGITPKIAASDAAKTDFSPQNPLKMVAIGRLDPIKGFDKLIKEVAKLQIDFDLQIAGSGAEYERLDALIKELKLQKKVHLIGFCDDTARLLKEADLLLISSIKEGLPLVLMEGIFYAKMVLCTPAGEGIGEILDAHFITSIDEMAAKIEAVAADFSHNAADFSAKHTHLKQKLTLKNHINELVLFYKGILGGKDGKRSGREGS